MVGTGCVISLALRRIVDRENGVGILILDPWRVWAMGEFVCQAGVVLAIREVRDSETKDGSNCYILPVMTVVHSTGNRDKGGNAEGKERNPCFGSVPPLIEQVEFTGKVKRQESLTGERQAGVTTGETPKTVIEKADVGLCTDRGGCKAERGVYRPYRWHTP